MPVHVETDGPVTTIELHRPERRNAIDRAHAQQLADAVRNFEADPSARVAVLTGAAGHFCAGADLHAVAEGRANRVEDDGDGPLRPTRMRTSRPILAAIEGYAVAGGLELACWCDLRVASTTARLGVFCRRWGVPLIDGGTVRLPRLIGQSHALDLILTGREIDADEAFRMGLVNRVVPAGQARQAAVVLAHQIAAHPQICLRGDRASVLEQWSLPHDQALRNELQHGRRALQSETRAGAQAFSGRERSRK